MPLEADLRSKLTTAIKARDLRVANIIRMISTKVMERRTAKGFTGEVDDALYTEVIASYKKSLEKAQEAFRAAGDKGANQVVELQFEIDYCAALLPAGMSEGEIRAAVRAAIASVGAADPKLAGRVVGMVMKEHKGKVDAAVVKSIAEAELAPK